MAAGVSSACFFSILPGAATIYGQLSGQGGADVFHQATGEKAGCIRIGVCLPFGRVAQLVRAPASHAGGPGFESLRAHHSNLTRTALLPARAPVLRPATPDSPP